MKQLEKFKDIDPDKYQEALEKLRDAEEGDAKKTGKLDTLVEQRAAQRVAQMKQEWETRFTNTDAENKKLKVSLEKAVIEQGILTAATGKVRSTAVEDLLNRAKRVFKLNENANPIPVGPDGETLYGADGNPLTFKGWVDKMLAEAPHLFEGGTGGGATNHAGSVNVDGPNPFAPATRTLTKQMALRKSSPERARALAAAAGVKF